MLRNRTEEPLSGTPMVRESFKSSGTTSTYNVNVLVLISVTVRETLSKQAVIVDQFAWCTVYNPRTDRRS